MFRIAFALLMFSLNCAVLAQEGQADTMPQTTVKHSLIEIYCGAMVMEPLDFSSQLSLDSNWEALGESLSEGKLYSNQANSQSAEDEFDRLKVSATYQKCAAEHSRDFELGEFILEGRHVLRQTVATIKEDNNPVLLSASFLVEDREVNAGPFEFNIQGMVDAGAQSARANSELELKGISERQDRYHQLWQEFLIQLKANTHPVSTAF